MTIYNSHLTREQFEQLAEQAFVVSIWHITAAVAVVMSPLVAYAFYLHYSI